MTSFHRKRTLVGILLLFTLHLGRLGVFYSRLPADFFHAPRWVLYIQAIVLGFGAGQAFLGQEHCLSHLLAAFIWVLFAASGAWAALLGSPDAISGGNIHPSSWCQPHRGPDHVRFGSHPQPWGWCLFNPAVFSGNQNPGNIKPYQRNHYE
jgi:hypothetical protein